MLTLLFEIQDIVYDKDLSLDVIIFSNVSLYLVNGSQSHWLLVQPNNVNQEQLQDWKGDSLLILVDLVLHLELFSYEFCFLILCFLLI